MRTSLMRLIISTLLLLIVVSCSNSDRGSLTGRVIKLNKDDQESCEIKLVIEGGDLKKPRTKIITGKDIYRIDNLPPGDNYSVTFYKKGHHDITRCGVFIRPGEETVLDITLGRWQRSRDTPKQELTEEQNREIQKLMGIGYLSGYTDAPANKNVTTHDSLLAYQGLNIYTSGHAATSYLIDMHGNVIHQWSFEQYIDWPQREHNLQERPDFWRRVHVYPNGDLLAIYAGLGIIKINRDSKLLWVNPNGAHHDLDVVNNGRIYVLTRKARLNPEINKVKPVLEDFISILTPDGETIKEISIYEAFRKSSYRNILKKMDRQSDLFHINTIEVFDGKLKRLSPFFKKGNVLISSRVMDNIAIVDIAEEKVVWSAVGNWKNQHQPTLLDNGRILLFDNIDTPNSSKVIEIDPFTKEVHWVYRGLPAKSFFTKGCGSNQRLPNGNTLIVESNNGRAFEVTPCCKIVWEFYNPQRAGEHKELVATLFDVVRLEHDYFTE